MKTKTVIFIVIATIFIYFGSNAQNLRSQESGNFDIGKDLLLAHFDCKTDVDDLQSAAALVTLLSESEYSQINYHAVAGAYGIQGKGGVLVRELHGSYSNVVGLPLCQVLAALSKYGIVKTN